ncbi:MAG: type IV pilus twitching motility protein PilT [Acidobacteria bacterium]|nr:type IV pilus twitching motility protein PilT [Acidobacteriota bacterium]MBU1473281.1 type IV pilus twitching motility protein PilT [Acidobacteriota bacterium]
MQMIDLLKKLGEMKGSDLHIMAGLHPAFRIHGKLVPMTEYDRFTPQSAKELIYSVLNDYQKQTFERDPVHRGELDFALGVSGLGRFRFNIHLQRGSVAAAVRSLSKDIPRLEDLGLHDSINKFALLRKGLVLVTGPSGSGKSTTLAALIDIINRSREDHIITVEDPIEYLHNSKKSYVTQREVGISGDTLSFKNALKYALRQDPDVILIGEMRDYETIRIAITSAETGQLVFGTLHTASAAKTISRIIDVFPAEQQPQVRSQMASNLVGVVSQILLPRADRPGRVAANEVMFANAAVRNNIRSGKTEAIYQTLQTSGSEGMISMDQSLTQLVKSGQVDFDAARPFMYDKITIENLKAFRKTPVSMPQKSPTSAAGDSVSKIPPWERNPGE